MIAIKDFGMPKQCASCFAKAMVDGEISTYEICTLTQSVLSTEDLCDRRNTNCPLVEIGTCKDCKHWCHIDGYDSLDTCRLSLRRRHSDFYCAGFERRENNNDKSNIQA